MHELGMCEAVVEAIRRRAHGRRVTWAKVRVGGHPVDPDVISQGVAVAAAGTEAEGLTVEVVLDPLLARCRRCGAAEPVDDAVGLAVCRACGGLDVELVGADHVVLEALAYRDTGTPREPGPGATGPSAERQTREVERGEQAWMRSSS